MQSMESQSAEQISMQKSAENERLQRQVNEMQKQLECKTGPEQDEQVHQLVLQSSQNQKHGIASRL